MATITPTIRLRRLGMALRDHREAAGLTLDDAAHVLMRSPSSLSRIEKGLHHLPVRDLEYILGKYGVTDAAITGRLFDWCRNGRKKGWWQRYATDLSPEMMDFIGLESDATSIDFFDVMLIPGLLQTEQYARALFKVGPFAHLSDRVERLIAVRMKRQEVLRRANPPRVHAIVDEAAVRRLVGGPATTKSQLRRLVEASEASNMTLQVLPFAVGEYQGMTGSFTIMDIAPPGSLTLVTVDSLTSISYREEVEDVHVYMTAFEHLRAKALSEDHSRAMIERLMSKL
ncbi:helix-turn-helix transcriptional regulator [Actinoallomurus sp. NPDC050550]|uniref:helix-turn-helix domain-containing protein n=1 Tax=Actinoallomurus sp. NPDC050550 TaxID=3154937 RepID=UPI0034069F10